MASKSYQTTGTIGGASVGVALVSGLFLSFLYSFIELQTAYFHRTPGCNEAAFVSALLPTNETAPRVFWYILAARFIALSAVIYVLLPYSRRERNSGQIVLSLIVKAFAAILPVMWLYYIGAQPTRVCVSPSSFSYGVGGINRDYKWGDIVAVKSECASHGIADVGLKINDGSELILPPSFLFAPGQDRLVSIIDSLNIEFIGLTRPLTYASLCSHYR